MRVSIQGASLVSVGNLPKNAEHSMQYLLVRLLIGAFSLHKGSAKISLKTDYSVLTPVRQTKNASVAFGDFLNSYSLGDLKAQQFITKTLPDNRRFYQEILCEFIFYFVQSHKGCHTAAFVFLYRALERISFSVPLLYSSRSIDYYNTHKDLKAIFSLPGDQDLGLLKKFIEQRKFIDDLKLRVVYDVKFSGDNAAECFELAKKFCSHAENIDPTLHQFGVQFQHVLGWFISLRNRFFHSRTGDTDFNIKGTELHDPDEFFGQINPVFCSFLAIIVLQSISHKYQT